jgi:hypothetical protein
MAVADAPGIVREMFPCRTPPMRRDPLPALIAAVAASLALLAAPARAQNAPPPIPPIESAAEIGLVKQNAHVLCRDGLYSALVGKKSVWVFGDTCLNDGGEAGDTFIDNTLAWTTKLDASGGIRLNKDLADGKQVPVRFIPYTANELAVNAERAPNEIALWPGQIVNDPKRKRVLIFYGAVFRGSKIGFHPVGGGIAVSDPAFEKVSRPIESLDPEAKEPTYMWYGAERQYVGGHVLEGDMLYCYGGDSVGLSTHVHVARVPLADALDKTRWQYWNGTSWSADEKGSVTVYQGGAAGDTIFWSDWLGAYVTVYQRFLDNAVYYRVADRPEGPWSDEAVMFIARQGDANDPSYAARVHTEMSEDGGRTIYVTYAMTTGLLRQSLPIEKVTFGAMPAR